MKITGTLKKMVKKIIFPNSYSNGAFIEYLRRNGVCIGDNVVIWAPNHTIIDIQKPWMISIGDNTQITEGVKILAHDYSISTCRKVYGQFACGGGLPVCIGNNVFIGMNAIILMGTNIGNNSIVGAGSVVKGNFPDGSIIAGNPARVIGNIENYYQKNLNEWVCNAKRCAKTIYKNSGHIPTIEEMSDGYAWLYLERTEENINKYKSWFDLPADDFEKVKSSFLNSEPYYSSFDEFIKECGFDSAE